MLALTLTSNVIQVALESVSKFYDTKTKKCTDRWSVSKEIEIRPRIWKDTDNKKRNDKKRVVDPPNPLLEHYKVLFNMIRFDYESKYSGRLKKKKKTAGSNLTPK